MTIFVSVASYRDTELVPTIKSLLENADSPELLHFGVLSQDLKGKHPDLSFVQNLTYKTMHSKDAKGAGHARKIVMEMYDGEDFFFQTDSHMRFVKGWDSKLIDMWRVATEEAGPKIILSQFPAPYEIYTDGSLNIIRGDKDFWDDVSWTSVVNTFYGAWAGNREVMEDRSKPHPSHTILAGLLFSHGGFVEDIPYDERISFMGEELCIAIRAYTRGYKIFAPNEMVCYHFYKRPHAPKVWSGKDQHAREHKWTDIEMQSKRVQEKVLLGIEQGIYGIGSDDLYEEYQRMIGIDFASFYGKELARKTNLSLLFQEMDIFMTMKSGYCMEEFHEECINKRCECTCHEGKER